MRLLDKLDKYKEKKNKLDRKEFSFLKNFGLALINLVTYLESIEDYKRLWETLQLSNFFINKYINRLDEVSKLFDKV